MSNFIDLLKGGKFTKRRKPALEVGLKEKSKVTDSKVTENPNDGNSQSFKDLNITKTLDKLNELNLNNPTKIQQLAIPLILQNKDLIAISPTGSGKTLAFLVPILEIIGENMALIITPTRELASQIHRILVKVTDLKTIDLTAMNNLSDHKTLKKLKATNILISTPLKLISALRMEIVKLDKVKHLVLDEADKLLDKSFLEQIDEILSSCPDTYQKLFFSATISSSIESLAKNLMSDYEKVTVGLQNSACSDIKQELVYVGSEEGKLVAIRQMITSGFKPPCLIFVQSIERAKELFYELVYDGINVDVIHSERSISQRQMIIESFRSGKIWVLITTEVMGRGMDFKGVGVVVNYDFPQTSVEYVHRIGRTGRNGREGRAITYFTKEDGPYLKSVVNVMKDSGSAVEPWMENLKKVSKNLRKRVREMPIRRDAIKTVSGYDTKKIQKKRAMIEANKRRKEVVERLQK